MESSANKYDVQQGTDRLANINEDKVLKVEELRAANALNLEGMKDFVKNNRKEAPKAPDANASHEAAQQYQLDLGAYNEMKSVLDRFDAQISALKSNYEGSKDQLKDATQEELAKLEAALGIEKKADAPATAPTAAPAAKEEKKEEPKAADAKPAETKVEAKPAATETKEAPKTAEYVVKKGDTLGKIAKEHGTTWQELKKENGITDEKRLQIGQKLKVPAKAEAKGATDAEAAKAAKPATPEAGKGDKPADGKAEAKPSATEKKAEAKAEETPKAAAAKPGDAPAPAPTATLVQKDKIEATANPGPTNVSLSDLNVPFGG